MDSISYAFCHQSKVVTISSFAAIFDHDDPSAKSAMANSSLDEIAQVDGGNNCATIVKRARNVIWDVMKFSQGNKPNHFNDAIAL